jgi:hypothetical protein
MVIYKKIFLKIKLISICLVFLILSGYFFVNPFPKSIVRLAAGWGAAWVLNDSDQLLYGFENPMQKFFGEMLQQSLIDHFHSRRIDRNKNDDAMYAGKQLDRLRPLLINQSQLPHNPISGPVGLSGLAWCDTANGLAGRLLAHDFDDVQLVGVRFGDDGGGHSFGRFWSNQYRDWLYFDIWTEEVVIFLSPNLGDVVYLYRSQPLSYEINWPNDTAAARKSHAMIYKGYIHNKLQSSVFKYYLHRIFNLLFHGSTATIDAIDPLEVDLNKSISIPKKKDIMHKINGPNISIYAYARIEHFFGNYNEAYKLYKNFELQDQNKSLLGGAAHIFSERLKPVRLLE